MCRLFLGVALFALVSNDTHDMNLPASIVNSIAHGFAVDGQTFVDAGKLCVPLLEGSIKFDRCYANQDVTDGALAGDAFFSVAVVAAETFTSFWRQGLSPIGDRFITAHSA